MSRPAPTPPDPRVARAQARVATLSTATAAELVELAELALGDLRACERDGGDMVGTDAYPVVRDAWPAIAARLDDAATDVQLAAAYLLAFLLEPADEILPRLERAAAAAVGPTAQAGLVLARARLAASLALWRGTTPQAPFDGIALVAEAAQAAPLLRAALALGQVWQLPRFPRKCLPDVAAALDAVDGGVALGPWGGGDLSVLTSMMRAGLWVQQAATTTSAGQVVYQADGVQATLTPADEDDGDDGVEDGGDEDGGDEDDGDEDDGDEDDGDEDDGDEIGSAEVADPYTQRQPARQAPRIVLTGLRDADWAALEHAYGPASGVPGMIDGLSSPAAADRAWAIEALGASIHHQGSVYPASTVAVPFLIQLAAAPGLEGRHLILELLCGIAVHQPDGCLIQGARRWRSEAYDAVVAGGPTYVQLLADADPQVRTGAAYVLAYVDPPPPGALAGLRAALVCEHDRRARACALLALGYVSRYLESVEDRALLASYLDADAPLVATAAAIALMQLAGADAPAAARGVLSRAPDALAPVRGFFPWAKGEVTGFARTIRQAFQSDDELWTLIDAALAGDAGEDAARAAPRLFNRVFRDDVHGRARPWLPDELDEPRRKLLRYFLAVTERRPAPQVSLLPFWEGANDVGLFSNADDIERLLGDTPGPLDQRLALGGVERPVWAWIIAANARLAEADGLVEAVQALPAEERLALAADVLGNGFRLTTPRWHTEYGAEPGHPEGPAASNDYTSRALLLVADLIGDGDEVERWAREIADAEGAKGAKRNARHGLIAARVLARAATARGEVLDPARDALLAFDQAPATTYLLALRALLRTLPGERAAALLANRPMFQYQGYVDPRGEVRRWHNGPGWEVADLAPREVTVRLVLDAIREWQRHRGAGDDRRATPVLGTSTSSSESQPGPDQDFPRARAIELLAGAGDAAIEAIDAALAEGVILDRALLDEARAGALAAAN